MHNDSHDARARAPNCRTCSMKGRAPDRATEAKNKMRTQFYRQIENGKVHCHVLLFRVGVPFVPLISFPLPPFFRSLNLNLNLLFTRAIRCRTHSPLDFDTFVIWCGGPLVVFILLIVNQWSHILEWISLAHRTNAFIAPFFSFEISFPSHLEAWTILSTGEHCVCIDASAMQSTDCRSAVLPLFTQTIYADKRIS